MALYQQQQYQQQMMQAQQYQHPAVHQEEPATIPVPVAAQRPKQEKPRKQDDSESEIYQSWRPRIGAASWGGPSQDRDPDHL